MRYEMKATIPLSRHRYFLFILILLGIALMLFVYNIVSFINLYHTYSQSQSKIQKDLVILLWTWPSGYLFPLNECPESDTPQCFYTVDRSFYNTADAVIFHHRDVCDFRIQMPQIPRPEGQYWVWFNMESPTHSPNLHYMDRLINLTMSYLSDSDIFTPYGWLKKNEAMLDYDIPNKTRLVAWAVSNWKPYFKRSMFYEELKKHISIDIYGRQHLSLDREETHTVLSQYKFYLAFENSIHTDYITEKLWDNAFLSGCVPVVLGPPRENYERFIPPDSFIHVDDFPNQQELAAYLLELDKNNEKYEQYFKWRLKLRPISDGGFATHYCNACAALHRAPSYRTMPNLVKWYT